jgi:hemerythrin-like domain-containing protein
VAREAGVEHQSYVRTGDRPYEIIVQLSEQLGCDLIFMASHGRRGLRSLIPGSQTQKVLAHTRLPVLVCSVEQNVPTRPMDAALASIEVEHRSLSAVLHGLFSLVRAAHSGQAEPDLKLMRAMLHYIRWMPEALHHPKEEAYLFPLLQQRTHEVDEAIAEARRHHARTPVLAAALETGLKAYEADPARGFGEFLKTANEFAEAAWLHMSQEEKLILPAAAQHFTATDWAAIRAAFGEDGDPRFAADVEQGFRNLFTRIMNLMPDAKAGGATTGPGGGRTAPQV